MNEAYLLKSDYENILQFQFSLHENLNEFPIIVLKTLHDLFGFSCLSFFLVDENGKFFNYEGINFSQDALKKYTEYFYLKDPIYHKNLSNTPYANKDTSIMSELLEYRELEKTEYYNDFFKKCDFYHEVGIYLKYKGRHIGAMGAMKPKNDCDFTQREHALLNTLTTIISQQLKFYLDTYDLNGKKLLYKNSFLYSPIGAIILNADFFVMDKNTAALEYCRDIVGRGYADPIEKAIKDIFNYKQLERKADNSFVFSGYQGYTFEIIPTLVPSISSRFNLNYVIYIKNHSFYEKTESKSYPEKVGLTKREMEVVDLIAQGYTNKEIGAILFISHQTVRTHIENVMTKLQVKNRTAILYKLGKVK